MNAEGAADGDDRERELEEVVLALGSNVGDRLGHLQRAVRGLVDASLEVRDLSSVVESPPAGVAAEIPQGHYLNAAVRARTSLAPMAVLGACRSVEAAGGRTRSRRGAPRTLDVDIVFHGDRLVRTEELVVPHPRWKERGFVLRPLLDVAADWRDPESGTTVERIAGERPSLLEHVRVVASPEELGWSSPGGDG